MLGAEKRHHGRKASKGMHMAGVRRCVPLSDRGPAHRPYGHKSFAFCVLEIHGSGPVHDLSPHTAHFRHNSPPIPASSAIVGTLLGADVPTRPVQKANMH